MAVTSIPNVQNWTVTPQNGQPGYFVLMNTWLGQTTLVIASLQSAITAQNAANAEINSLALQVSQDTNTTVTAKNEAVSALALLSSGSIDDTTIGVDKAYSNSKVNSIIKKRKNYLINGNFQFWDYLTIGVTSQTTAGYGSDNRWENHNTGSTKTHIRMTSSDVERALFESPYYSRTVVSSVTGVSNNVNKTQYIEDVTKLAGKTVTLSFWAKADSNKNMAVNFLQDFGTGGTPSNTIGLGVTTINLTTSWQRKTVTVTFPSLIGKTLGTDGVHTSKTLVQFFFDAGSDYNSRTNSLGQQSGTFDIADVKLEDGSIATDGWAPYDGEWGSEAVARMRYYQIHILQGVGHGILYERLFSILPVTLRLSPSASLKNLSGIAGYISVDNGSAAATISASAEMVMITVSNTNIVANAFLTGIVTLSAEI